MSDTILVHVNAFTFYDRVLYKFTTDFYLVKAFYYFLFILPIFLKHSRLVG
jgi:hypothetical protein